MKPLSLDAINAISAYKVSEVSDGCYQFFTFAGSIGVDEGQLYGSTEG